MKKSYILSFLLCLVATSQTFASKPTVTTNGNYDFVSIAGVGHFKSSSGDWFNIRGYVEGTQYAIPGIYANQSVPVMNHCLALAEQLNLSRASGGSKLRIQVMPDPANKSFAIIQYCALYQ